MKIWRSIIVLCLVFCGTFAAFAQTINSRVINDKTGEGVPYATIQFGDHSGTITNEEEGSASTWMN